MSGSEHKELYISIFSVILVVGVVCNILIFLTMRHMPKQTSSTSYFKILALMDLVNVIYDAGFKGVGMIGLGFSISNDVCCRVDWWFDRWTTTVSTWLLAALAIDRLVCLRRPLWHRQHVTVSTSYWVAVATALIQMLLYIPMMILWDTSSGQCGVSVHYERWIADTYSILITYLDVTLLPAAFIATCNAFIVYTVYRSRRHTASNRADSKGATDLVGPLLGASVIFLVVTVVFSVFQQLRTETPQASPRHELYSLGQKIAISLNESINFFIYGLTSTAFRQALTQLFGWASIQNTSLQTSSI